MKRRAASAVLWLYCAWYLAAAFAAYLGTDPRVGPLIGVGAALVVLIGPQSRKMSPAR